MVATAGLDGLDLFEPMLAIRKLLKFCPSIWGNLYLALSRTESQTSILGWRVTLIAAIVEISLHLVTAVRRWQRDSEQA